MIGYTRAVVRFILFVVISSLYIFRYWLVGLIRGHTLEFALKLRRNWLNWVPDLLGVNISLHGIPKQITCIYVGNHRSYLDPVAVLKYIEALPLSKAEIITWPLIGHAAKLTGALFVQRDNEESRISARKKIQQGLIEDHAILIFPEGTTSGERQTISFRSGAFRIAAEMGIPVVPFMIDYDDPADAWIDDKSFISHLLRSFSKPIVDIRLSFGQPLESGDWEWLLKRSKAWIDLELEK
jgi:1-acyl-sn-glycerol-3-phosphate acyltransferase